MSKVLSVVFAALTVVLSLGLAKSIADNRERVSREERVSVCFTDDGRIAYGEDWKECRLVTIRR